MADFFDKLASGINKGVATVSANSKAVLDKAKVNTTIGNLENERKDLVQLLGQKVYTIYKERGEIAIDDSLTNFITEIDKRLALIEQKREELKRIEAELKLVSGGSVTPQAPGAACACGHVNPEGAKFCAKCGGAQG